MRVLMISGDPNILRAGTSAHARFLLQQAQVEALEVVFWPQNFFKPFSIQGSFDVVTSQDPFWRGLVAFFAAKRLHAKLNIQLHAELKAQSFIKRVLARFVLLRAGSVRVVSQRLKDAVVPLTHAPVSVLPIFIDIEKFKNLSHASHKRFEKNVLWIGRFEDEKDPLLALSVFKEVRLKVPQCGLVMLGSGSLENILKEKAKEYGLFDAVEFPGWRDASTYLEHADVVLCTSREESWGASIIEALAAHVPVVSLDVGVALEAGAKVVSRPDLATKTIEYLESGERGNLLITLLTQDAWAKAWRETL